MDFTGLRRYYKQGEDVMKDFEFKVLLNSIEGVKEFCNITTGLSFELDVVSTSSKYYCVDGKSIMGIFSLDLSKALKVVCHCISEKEGIMFKEQVAKFVVE